MLQIVGSHTHIAAHFVKAGEPPVCLTAAVAGKAFGIRQEGVNLSGQLLFLGTVFAG